MAFPWIFESSLGDNVNTTPFGWDSEQDTGSLLDAPHYSELARFPWSNAAPYRGAYCMRVAMGDTNDHTLREGDIDIADAATRFSSFYLYFAPNVAVTADDTFNIYELQQAAGTVESSLGLRILNSTQAIEIGIGDGTAPTDFATSTLERNRWYHIELRALISTTGTGELELFVDGVSVVSLTTLTNAAAVGRADLGTQDTLSTTTGTILFDRFIFDDLRIFPDRERFPNQMTLTQSGHVFVGPGSIEGTVLLSTTANNEMRIWDTDSGNVDDGQGFVVELDVDTHTSVDGPFFFRRGCFVSLTGTDPRGSVSVTTNHHVSGGSGPTYYNAWGIRHYGLLRKERPGNV